MFLPKLTARRVAVAAVAVALVFAQQVHAANAGGTSEDGGVDSDTAVDVRSAAQPGQAETDGSTQSTPGDCVGRNAFGRVEVHVNEQKVGGSEGPTPGSPFDGWQELVTQGSDVAIGFMVAEHCGSTPVALASYENVEPFYRAENAHRQVLFDSESGTYSADGKMHWLEVSVPDCYFQVDFAPDKVYKNLTPESYKDNLGGAALGGTRACAPKAPVVKEIPTTTTSTTTSTTVVPKPVCPADADARIRDYSVEVKDSDGDRKAGLDHLTGNVTQGAEVTVRFMVVEGCQERLSLATYEADSTSTDLGSLARQTYFDGDTDVFGPGKHKLTASVPECLFQVDFVRGPIIKELGRSGSGSTYGNRLIDTDIGGEKCDEPEPQVLEKTVVREVPVPVQQPPRVLAVTGIDLFPMFATGAVLLLIGTALLGGARLWRRNSYWYVA